MISLVWEEMKTKKKCMNKQRYVANIVVKKKRDRKRKRPTECVCMCVSDKT